MNWKYSATDIVAITVFLAFCIGMCGVLTGLLTIILSIFIVSTTLTEIGTTALFYGLAVVFVCAGIGCFIPDKEKVLVK